MILARMDIFKIKCRLMWKDSLRKSQEDLSALVVMNIVQDALGMVSTLRCVKSVLRPKVARVPLTSTLT